MKRIKSLTFDELIKTKAQIELAIHTIMLKKAMGSVKMNGTTNGAHRPKKLKRHPQKDRKLPVRFRNPKNPKEAWAGRGLTPRWLVAALKGGRRKLSDFAVS